MTRNETKQRLLWMTLLALLAPVFSARADTQGVVINSTTNIIRTGLVKGNDGWRFVPTADIYVTSLGYFDADDDGLLARHTVGVFRASDGVLQTPLIDVLPSDPLAQRFRWHAISAVMLQAGVSYTIAGFTKPPFDPVTTDVYAKFTPDSVLGFKNYRWNFEPFFSEPTFTGGVTLTLGPNLRFQTQDPVAIDAASWGAIKALY